MTTIAWDGKTLAGDTQSTSGGLIRRLKSKVHRIEMPDGRVVLVGLSGCEEDAPAIVNWIKRGMPENSRPTFERDSVSGLLITQDGAFHIESQCIPMPIEERFHAIGSGRDFAIAAMHLGRSAREAVELAARYDIYTSLPVTEVTLDG